MSILEAVRNLNNATEFQRSEDRARQVEESFERGRNVGGNMGKHDFLMLLSTQLRNQDPLNPSTDSEFAAQLAQFSSLEQMQNMNTSLEIMANMQSYSLVGKFVIADLVMGGLVEEIAGEVDSIFIRDGVTFAQIGEIAVPITDIREVFNTSNLLNSDRFLQTSAALVGREVLAEVDGEDIKGVVRRILVDKGRMYAQLDVGRGELRYVPVNAIVDIGEVGTASLGHKPETPPDAVNFRTDPDGGFFELSPDDVTTVIGRWDWDVVIWRWVFTPIGNENGTPPTGDDKPGEGGTPPANGNGNPYENGNGYESKYTFAA